jgi:hypothetical protein
LALKPQQIGVRNSVHQDDFGSIITVRALCRKALKRVVDTDEPVAMVWEIQLNGNLWIKHSVRPFDFWD